MLYPFEAKYISVNWTAEHNVRSIIESRDILEPKKTDEYQYFIEAITYSKIDDGQKPGQLAFHISDFDDSYLPYFIKSSGDREFLVSIEDPETHKIWWIEAGSWKKWNGKLYRDSPLCRYAGEAKIEFGNVLCRIKIRSLSFSYEELDLYIRDFRNDLWGLILNDDSYISAAAKTQNFKDPKEELFEYLNTFTKFVQNLLINPKKELRESRSLQAAEKVRPIPRTFMEIATKGQSKLLTGRAYNESYDVAENRYVYAIVNRISILLQNLSKVSEQRGESYKHSFANLYKRLNDFSATIEIDKDVLESEVDDLSKKIIAEKSQLEGALLKQLQHPGSHSTLVIRLEYRGDDYKNWMSFWGKAKLRLEDDWHEFDKNSSLSFMFM
jgi:hypothetical protein